MTAEEMNVIKSLLSEHKKALDKNCEDTSNILTLLQGDKFGNPGLVSRVEQAEKKILNAENKLMKIMAVVIFVAFCAEQGIRLVFPGSLK